MNFLFSVVIWGQDTNLFLSRSLPTQLSPGNLPFISQNNDGRNRYRIYTTRNDASEINNSPLLTQLQTLMPVEWVFLEEREINSLPPRTTLLKCHAHAIESAVNDDSFPVFIYPDSRYAENSFAGIHKAAAAGKRAIFVGEVSSKAEQKGSSQSRAGIAESFFDMGRWFSRAGMGLQAEAAFIKACEIAPDLRAMYQKIEAFYRQEGNEFKAQHYAQLACGPLGHMKAAEDPALSRNDDVGINDQVPAGKQEFAGTSPLRQQPRQPSRQAQTEYPDYPYQAPPIRFQPGLDMLLVELPPRHLPMMPNGVGYVHNILKQTGVRYQTVDTNIIVYHRFHARRLAGDMELILPDGRPMPDDPWDILNITLWSDDIFLENFETDIDEIADGIIQARPRILGLSLNIQNVRVASLVAEKVRAALPETKILVGGYSCVHHEIGPRSFKLHDYMFIGEAELTLPPLVKSLLKGEEPRDLPGIISPFDSPGRVWEPGPRPQDLDAAGYPNYEWIDISLYHTFEGGQLVPISASRGCSWSRCNFCAEKFAFRKRNPEKVVEEISWMVGKGFSTFHFNESDVNGDPNNLRAICEGIIRNNLKIVLMGQLRIDRRNTLEYFKLLRAAGFTDLRFGVDGWSDNVLRLQKKGYTMDIVHQNLRDCFAAGIRVQVNMIIGVPGETDRDIEEYIANLLRNKAYISSVENVNTLIFSYSSEYYTNPDRYNIRFRGNKEELYKTYMEAIPTEFWYSTEPYIDQEVRLARMRYVIDSVRKEKMVIGSYAEQVIHNLDETAPMEFDGRRRP